MKLLSFEVPLQEDLAEELIQFWCGMFKTPYESFRGILLGNESTQNYDIIYLSQVGKQIIGTCHLTMSNSLPIMGGLGEAATHPEFRRRGIASKLCKLALDNFCRRGGQALFLGTVNPAAARVYYRLGWRKLAGANVMVNITTDISQEAFLTDYFGEKGSAMVVPATAAERIPMIPLIVSPHEWQVLDANIGMFSTRS